MRHNLVSQKPIRFRIRTALFIAGAFSILLTFYFSASYLSIKKTLSTKSDDEVYEQLDSILSQLRSSSGEHDFQRIASEHNTTGEASLALKLVRTTPRLQLIASQGPSKLRTLLDSHTFVFNQLPQDVHSGITTIRVFARSNSSFLLYGAINTIAAQEVFDAMLSTYLILLVTGIALSFVLGMLTADLALKPLNVLLASAKAIQRNDPEHTMLLPTTTRTQEINQLAMVINDILIERDRNIAALKNFTADAAHELRTPLTILKGELEVDLRTKSLSADERETLESNLEEVHRLIRIVEDLLTLARIEQSNEEPSIISEASWPLGALLDELVDRLEPMIAAKQLRVKKQYSVVPDIRFLRNDCERIFYNILLNAVQYNTTGGSITIEVASSATAIIVSITDNGKGMTADQISHIFDRFWRADRSRSRAQGGTGLGLTIAKTFADKLGFTITCHSTPSVGTTMIVSIPTAK